jgi:hypothetical protein
MPCCQRFNDLPCSNSVGAALRRWKLADRERECGQGRERAGRKVGRKTISEMLESSEVLFFHGWW